MGTYANTLLTGNLKEKRKSRGDAKGEILGELWLSGRGGTGSNQRNVAARLWEKRALSSSRQALLVETSPPPGAGKRSTITMRQALVRAIRRRVEGAPRSKEKSTSYSPRCIPSATSGPAPRGAGLTELRTRFYHKATHAYQEARGKKKRRT